MNNNNNNNNKEIEDYKELEELETEENGSESNNDYYELDEEGKQEKQDSNEYDEDNEEYEEYEDMIEDILEEDSLQYTGDKILARSEELVSKLQDGIVETFEATKDESEIGKYIKLEFEDIGKIKESQFELIGNLVIDNGEYELLLENKATEGYLDTYSVGYINITLATFKTIEGIFPEGVTIRISEGSNRERMPYKLYKTLGSNQFKTEEEIQQSYRSLGEKELTIEDILRRNITLY